MTPIDASLFIDDSGWCTSVPRRACTNFDARPEGIQPSLLVVHNISLPPGEFGGDAIEALFANTLNCNAHPYFEQLRGLKVSAHFLIRRDGGILQFVSTEDRAWHAGTSEFQGRQRCNDFSIGIELEGSDAALFCDAQYESLFLLTRVLYEKYPLTHVVGHEHIAPGRKTDPGPGFDWQRFAVGWTQIDGNSLFSRKSKCVLGFPG